MNNYGPAAIDHFHLCFHGHCSYQDSTTERYLSHILKEHKLLHSDLGKMIPAAQLRNSVGPKCSINHDLT